MPDGNHFRGIRTTPCTHARTRIEGTQTIRLRGSEAAAVFSTWVYSKHDSVHDWAFVETAGFNNNAMPTPVGISTITRFEHGWKAVPSRYTSNVWQLDWSAFDLRSCCERHRTTPGSLRWRHGYRSNPRPSQTSAWKHSRLARLGSCCRVELGPVYWYQIIPRNYPWFSLSSNKKGVLARLAVYD